MENLDKYKSIFKFITYSHILILTHKFVLKNEKNNAIFKSFIDNKENQLNERFAKNNKKPKNIRNKIVLIFTILVFPIIKNLIDTFIIDAIFNFDRITNNNEVNFIKKYTIYDHIYENKFIPSFFKEKINGEKYLKRDNFNNLNSNFEMSINVNSKDIHQQQNKIEISSFKSYKI